MSTRDAAPVALIFEGGGMRGSLTSGVVVALLEAGLRFDWVAGVSAGSTHLVNYLSGDPVRARAAFVDFAADPQFGNLRTFLRGKGLFHAEYIYEHATLPGQALPFDWDAFRASPAATRIVTFRARDGKQVVVTEDDLHTPRDLMLAARASSTMPVVMPLTRIGEDLYADGALGTGGGIALDVAKAEGFERFAVVLSQPRDHVRGPLRHPGFFRRALRRHPQVAQAMLTRHVRYNATREEVFALERQGRAVVFAPHTMPVANGTRDVSRLAAAHELGLRQARAQMPAWREFLQG